MPVHVLSQVPAGILLPDTILASEFFAVFSAFVGINTVIYVVLAVAKILPKIYFTDWVRGSNRRAAARSIYAVAEIPVRPPPPPTTVAVTTLEASVRRVRESAHPLAGVHAGAHSGALASTHGGTHAEAHAGTHAATHVARHVAPHAALRGRPAPDHQLAHQHERERGDEDPDVDERH
ncbi:MULTISPECIES: hypothetical protein [Cryobacterium]|uniref:Uncharacterized protein n=1 Tax=Cryobacterium glucosi TaxID=1259175 RepID=A0ABY2IM00_9MICO|nr:MULTISPECIES: hypothetical protein [Cryobacterium]TFB98504.1 hypothetical protein E3O39_06600 [Cryobacterium sp. MDB2-A-1]TFC08387.1 hypothetical protein E3O59_07965 [Cryobacterium sp. MDB2-33-2]TFC08653.1 hypothetical protein E3O35_17270 [Cryobacterium sp. MDB2-A-2]TFC20454.1 hypothetical protein E3O46_09545 [Cryobacterium glucosi]TFC22291.1 hypothetical protein E3O51_02715 [Cryobacterium sp. MDB2-10]